MRGGRIATGLATVLLLAGCSADAGTTSAPAADPSTRSAPSTSTATQTPSPDQDEVAEERSARTAPLRHRERFVDVGLSEPYTPSAPGAGTDDYRCFLLDPGLERDAFVTGMDVAPGSDLVHHVILFRVPPDTVPTARAVDRRDPGQGWTCFGGSGLEGAGASLDDAPWLGAWAPGGGEQVLARDIGTPVEAGSRIVMQVHYSLLEGSAPDRTTTRLRLADGDKDLAALETMLLPAPVELPCRPGVEGPLCDRDAAVADVKERFGNITGETANFLNLLCAGTGPSPVQSCTRQVSEPATIRAVAGHMHLLGRRIEVEVNPGRPDARTVLDIPVWNFDDQGSIPVDEPVRIGPGDEVTVTCEHGQELRDLLPAFADQPERYVVWGEGTTDEMCLGVLLVTRP